MRLVNCHGEEWKTIDISHSINPPACEDSMTGVRAGMGGSIGNRGTADGVLVW